MFSSRQDRLQDDLRRWVEKRLITPQQAEALRDEAQAHDAAASGLRLPAVLGILGAVLLAAGVLMFVAANWDVMSRLSRLALLLAALWGALLAGAELTRRGHAWFSEGALLLAAAIFGANIWLIAQMYHIEGHYPDAILLWSLGALLVAVLLHGQAAMVLAMGLLGYWALAETLEFSAGPRWLFFLPWAIAAFASWRHGWRLALHAVLLALGAWFYAAALFLIESRQATAELVLLLQVVVGAGLFTAGLALSRAGDARARMLEIAASYGAALVVLAPLLAQMKGILPLSRFGGVSTPALLGLLALLAAIATAGVLRRLLTLADAGAFLAAFLATALSAPLMHVGASLGIDTGRFWLLSLAVLGLALWAMAAGFRLERKRLVRLGFALFAFEVVHLYFRAFGGLLDTSFFFLSSGALLIAMGFAYVKLSRRLSGHGGAS